jgi:hypothetical protein
VPSGGSGSQPRSTAPARLKAKPKSATERMSQPAAVPPSPPMPEPLSPISSQPASSTRVSRVRQRPPVPNSGLRRSGSIQARPRN